MKIEVIPSMQDIARVYLISETSIGTSIDRREDSIGSSVDSASRASGLMNFFGTYVLGSDFNILEVFARALVLSLQGRGV
jgi:hypothetical protein